MFPICWRHSLNLIIIISEPLTYLMLSLIWSRASPSSFKLCIIKFKIWVEQHTWKNSPLQISELFKTDWFFKVFTNTSLLEALSKVIKNILFSISQSCKHSFIFLDNSYPVWDGGKWKKLRILVLNFQFETMYCAVKLI